MAINDASNVRTFLFNWRFFWLGLAAIGFLSVIPAMSVWELVTTGQIDLDAVGRGRRQTPTWLSYLFGWILLIPSVPLFFYPLLKYLARGWVFKISDDSIIIDAQPIHLSEIESIKETVRGMRISTSYKRYYFHPRMSVSGYDALEAFIERHGLNALGSPSPRA